MDGVSLFGPRRPPLWHVAFIPGRARHWWSWFAWGGRWKHVACFRWDATCERWLVYQYGAEGILTASLQRHALGVQVEIWQRAGAKIVVIDEGTAVSAIRNPFLNCVGLVVSLTRRGSGALGPNALWRKLHREGCEPAWESEDGCEDGET